MSMFTSSENLAALSSIYRINKPAYIDARVNGERKMTILVETAGFLQICLQLWVMFNLATCFNFATDLFESADTIFRANECLQYMHNAHTCDTLKAVTTECIGCMLCTYLFYYLIAVRKKFLFNKLYSHGET